MTTDNKLTLAFGRRTFPEDVRAVWGARMIAPNDLVHDRQDLDSRDDEAKEELIHWLNNGAIAKLRDELLTKRYEVAHCDFDSEIVAYEDDKGKIVASSQSSGGYVYVCGWLHDHTSKER